ncbi:MAG: MoaD/ThiS family protein [Oscillospiraceae bacterium]
MQIIYNGSELEVAETDTVMDIINKFDYKSNITAVWLNGVQVLYMAYGTQTFSPGDNLKLVRLIGGG